MMNLKEVEKVAKMYNNDVTEITKELKKVQSQKCRLKKEKARKDYDERMSNILKKEQILKEARNLLNPKEKFVTQYEQEDVDKLDFDETMKAIRSIQSKKTHTQFLDDQEEYENACKIEKMLLEHKSKIKPVDSQYIRKSDLQTIIDTIESSGKLSQEKILELLNSLM